MAKAPDILPVTPTSEETPEQPHKPAVTDDKKPSEAETAAIESADDTTDERKIGFVRAGTSAQVNERDPKTQERTPEDAGAEANPADHADIAGE